MQYRRLGNTDIEVSLICLGTMTWGGQNSEADAHAQLDMALASGINFIDTAEMYAIPSTAETYGLTETYIGNWLQQRGCRDRVILATKVVGRSEWLPYIRSGQACLDRNNIVQALDASLKRLQTDTIDLYQLHWPDRPTNFFGQLGYKPAKKDPGTPIDETLQVLDDLIQAGKIRHIGISNETPWGFMRYLQTAENRGLPRIVSIQNPYSLLNRSFEIGNAEIAHRENVGLLVYSPLGFGVLSGKYLHGAQPAGARLTLFKDYQRYCKPNGFKATEEYVALAREHGLDPAQMALAFINSRPFITSTIIGATTLEQLRTDIDSVEVNLTKEVLDRIEEIHNRYPNPAP